MAMKEILKAVVIKHIAIGVSFMLADKITEAGHITVRKRLLINIFLNDQARDPELLDRHLPNRRGHILVDKILQEVPADVRSDRKSTRLNSSHVKISYAVFCLKNK